VLPLEFKLTELNQIKSSQSYALALKISALVGRLRSIKSAVLSKKKELNNPSSSVIKTVKHSWCKERAQIPDVKPLISIIIPFRDEPQLLDNCIRSVVSKTQYANYEIIAVSNDSVLAETHNIRQQLSAEFPQCRFIDHNIEFNFSALVNTGVTESKGDYVLLLNNDVEIASTDWLKM